MESRWQQNLKSPKENWKGSTFTPYRKKSHFDKRLQEDKKTNADKTALSPFFGVHTNLQRHERQFLQICLVPMCPMRGPSCRPSWFIKYFLLWIAINFSLFAPGSLVWVPRSIPHISFLGPFFPALHFSKQRGNKLTIYCEFLHFKT